VTGVDGLGVGSDPYRENVRDVSGESLSDYRIEDMQTVDYCFPDCALTVEPLNTRKVSFGVAEYIRTGGGRKCEC